MVTANHPQHQLEKYVGVGSSVASAAYILFKRTTTLSSFWQFSEIKLASTPENTGGQIHTEIYYNLATISSSRQFLLSPSVESMT